MSIERAEIIYDDYSDGLGNYTQHEFQEAVETIIQSSNEDQ